MQDILNVSRLVFKFGLGIFPTGIQPLPESDWQPTCPGHLPISKNIKDYAAKTQYHITGFTFGLAALRQSQPNRHPPLTNNNQPATNNLPILEISLHCIEFGLNVCYLQPNRHSPSCRYPNRHAQALVTAARASPNHPKCNLPFPAEKKPKHSV